MKIGIYARISTQDGRQDAENQLTPLRQWAERLGGVVVLEYVDQASGTKADRQALTQLLADAHLRKFDTVLIWALDRLSREGIARMTSYLERLKLSGVRVLSHQEGWLDTAGPVSELLQAVFAWIAKQERQRISERVQAGLVRAKLKGKRLGRPGVKLNIEAAFDLKEKGHSIRYISQFLGVPKSSVARALSQKPCSKAA
ncbi:MAG: recombinase family protein [Deltaproteobacteria bacterium]|nr:MAG: recombinase family protein [Deltaproteobacteria bacterium]